MSSLCRVCLDGNVAMYCIDDTKLLEIYEKLANTSLVVRDGKPKTICYICYSQLQRCFTLSKLARKSEQILNSLLNSGYEVTNETVDKLNYGNGMKKKFTVNALSYTVLPPTLMNQLYQETTTEVDVKEELIEAEEQIFDDAEIGDSLEIENFHANVEAIDIDNNIEVNKPFWDMCTENITKSKTEEHIEEKLYDNKESTNRIDSIVFTQKLIKTKPYYPCSECNETFTNKKKFAIHFRTHTIKTLPISKPLYCDICLKTFNKRMTFNTHMRIHARGRKFICDKCSKAFQTRPNLARHMKIHTGDKPFACDECGKKFRQKIHLKGHIVRGHTNNKLYPSNKKLYPSNKNLYPSNKKLYPCTLCHQSFSQKCNLGFHLRSHGIKPMCNKSRDKSFSQNGMSEEGKQHMTFICHDCGKSCSSKSSLKIHLRIHTGEKPPTCVCDTCNKTYRDKNALIRHITLHTGDKRYACDMCDKAYTQLGGLKKHLLSHLKIKEKICICYTCGKTFKTTRLLHIHMKIHNRNLICDMCAKAFSNKETLKIHLRVHTGEKPYKCKFCKKRFNSRSSLHMHLRIHTGFKPYVCDKCDKTFAQKISLDYHTRKHHH